MAEGQDLAAVLHVPLQLSPLVPGQVFAFGQDDQLILLPVLGGYLVGPQIVVAEGTDVVDGLLLAEVLDHIPEGQAGSLLALLLQGLVVEDGAAHVGELVAAAVLGDLPPVVAGEGPGDADLGAGLLGIEPVVRFQEGLDLLGDLLGGPEAGLDGVAHPAAVGDAHVAAVGAGFQQEQSVQVIGLSVVQLLQQLGDDAAVGVLGHDHGLAAGEAADVAVPVGLAEEGVVHLRDHQVHGVLEGEVNGHAGEEVAAHEDLTALGTAGVLPGVVHQFGEVLLNGPHLELVVIPAEGRIVGMVIASIQDELLIVEGVQVDLVEEGVQGAVSLLLLQVGPELLQAVLAEAAAGAHGGDGQLCLVQLDAGHTGIDLDLHDLLQVVPPDGVVAAGLVAGLGMAHHFHPLGMDGVAPPGPGSGLFLQVQDPLTVGVDDAVGVPVP